MSGPWWCTSSTAPMSCFAISTACAASTRGSTVPAGRHRGPQHRPPDARERCDPSGGGDRSRDRIVPQRAVGRLQDRRRHRPGAVRAVPAAGGCAAALGVSVWPMVELEADDALAAAARIAAGEPRVGRCASGRRTRTSRSASARSASCRSTAAARRFATPRRCARNSAWSRRAFRTCWPSSATARTAIPGIARDRPSRRGAAHWPAGPIEDFPPQVLGEQRELALLFKDLATLRSDATLFHRVAELQWAGPSARFAATTEQLGEPKLLARATRAAAARD